MLFDNFIFECFHGMKRGGIYAGYWIDLKILIHARSCARENSRGAVECSRLSRGKIKVNQYVQLVFADGAKLVPIYKRAVSINLKLTIKLGHIEVQRESLFVFHCTIKHRVLYKWNHHLSSPVSCERCETNEASSGLSKLFSITKSYDKFFLTTPFILYVDTAKQDVGDIFRFFLWRQIQVKCDVPLFDMLTCFFIVDVECCSR